MDKVEDKRKVYYLMDKNLTKLPDNLPKEVGIFNCERNNLTSLKGSPKRVNYNFNCSDNKLTTLEGGPKYVGSFFDCHFNKNLISLEGAPEYVDGDFLCQNNKRLTIFEIIKGLWNCEIKGKIVTSFEFDFKKFFSLDDHKKIKMLFEEVK